VNQGKKAWGVFLLLMFLGWGLSPAAGVSFTSAEQCKKCHADIYRSWSLSLHANALKDPVFETAYYKALAKTGEPVRQYCISCHAPTTRHTRDYYLKQKISQEGITCDYCHRITATQWGAQLPEVVFGKGNTQYGQLKESAATPAHKSEYSELYLKAEYCAACHEVKSPAGALVMETYSEWKAGPYAKDNINCQNCHMAQAEGAEEKAVLEEGKKEVKFYSDHMVLGGHSQIKLAKAAGLITSAQVKDNKVKVTCLVTNKESGHKIPTGIPLRRIILEVVLLSKDGKEIAKKNMVYQKVLVDAAGKVLTEPAEMFLNAARVATDNRIAPKEQREEHFEFDLPQEVDTFSVDSHLRYEFETAILAPQKMLIDMAKDTTVGERPSLIPRDVKKAVMVLAAVFLCGVLVTFALTTLLRRGKG
jgi:mono/diheme cytochrome c family protein